MKHYVGLFLLALPVAACSGGSSNHDGNGAGGGGVIAPVSPFTPMPTGSEFPQELFLNGDAAFNAGDFVTAQREFGSLFIVDPAFNNGVAGEAITATCERLGNDCEVLFWRLEFMQRAFYGEFGALETWVPQQGVDFDAILACHERILLGDIDGAIAAAGPVTMSPLQAFADAAGRCAARAEEAGMAMQQAQARDAALLTWFDNIDCMNENRRILLDAYSLGDWEMFVNTYPTYDACASPMQQIIDDEILMGDPRVGMDHDIAWSDMSEIEAIMEDNRATYEQTRDGMVAIDSDADYNRYVVEWNELDFQEQRLLNQIATLETTMANLDPGARGPIQGQVDALNADIRGVRDEKRRVMGAINAIRGEYGLSPRDSL